MVFFSLMSAKNQKKVARTLSVRRHRGGLGCAKREPIVFPSRKHAMPYDIDARHQNWTRLTPAQIRQYPGSDARGCTHAANCGRLWDNRQDRPRVAQPLQLELANEVGALTPGTSTLLSQPQMRQCSGKPALHFLRDDLYLFSFFPATERTLLTHFLRHYFGVGVQPAHATFVLHEGAGSWSDHGQGGRHGHSRAANSSARGRLDRLPSPSSPPSTAPAPPVSPLASLSAPESLHPLPSQPPRPSALMRRALTQAGVPADRVRVISSAYTDVLRMDAVNAFLATLPMSAWLIFADADEFFSYPCNLASRLAYAHVHPRGGEVMLCAHMVDRMAANGAFPALEAWPDISQQYPFECQLRGALNQFVGSPRNGYFQTSKLILHRVRTSEGRLRYFRTPHALVNMTTRYCPHVGDFAHYTLTRNAVGSLMRKHAMREDDAHSKREASNPKLSWEHAQSAQEPDQAQVQPSTAAAGTRPAGTPSLPGRSDLQAVAEEPEHAARDATGARTSDRTRSASHPGGADAVGALSSGAERNQSAHASEAFAPCALGRNKDGVCQDYLWLQRFVTAQSNSPQRELWPLCHVPKPGGLTARATSMPPATVTL